MRRFVSRLLAFEGEADHSHTGRRRIRTISAVALIALVISVPFSMLFLPTALRSGSSAARFVALNVPFLIGYVVAIAVNRRGRHEIAAFLTLSSGIGNVVGASLLVGFNTGLPVFLTTISIAAALITEPSRRIVRWFFIAAPLLAYGWLAYLGPVADGASSRTIAFFQTLNFAGMVVFVAAVVWYQRQLADTAEDGLTEANATSERLLLNILPADIAERLKTDEYPIADRKAEVTVLFADIAGSTAIIEKLSANDLVATLDGLFSSFDDIADRFGLEKIKTVGDNYFAVGGLQANGVGHTAATADAALAMRDELAGHEFPGIGPVRMRFGLHSGPVVAGVIGKRKFSYDLWGDTVNTASRMESTSDVNVIQVSQRVYEALKDSHQMESRGRVSMKGKGDLPTYALIGPRFDQ